MGDPDGLGSLYEQSYRFQLELARRDAQLATLLTRRYGEMYVELAGSFDSLALQVQLDIERGQVFTIDRLRRLDRYAYLMQQVDGSLDEFSRYASEQIGRQQATEVQAALRSAEALRVAAERQHLLNYPTQEGMGAYPPGADEQKINELFARIQREPLLHLIGTMIDGTPLYEYFRNGTANIPGLTPEVIDQIGRVLEQALLEGWNPRKAAEAFRDALGVGLNRALAIARTEMLRSYREATRYDYITYGVEQWQWEATMDLRTCLCCAMLDGQIFPVTEPMHSHVNCRCTMVPVVGDMGPRNRRVQWPEKGYMEGDGGDWFESLTEEQKREWMGGANYAAWHDGKVSLDDFIGQRYSDVFGLSYVQESLKGLLGADASGYYGR